MSLIHPQSKSMTSRDGCLTPNNQLDVKVNKKVNLPQANELNILSPPLSPYQRERGDQEFGSNLKSYLDNENQYKLENYKNYQLTINPYKSFKNFKSNQLRFLNKYSAIKEKELSDSHSSSSTTTNTRKRRYNTNSFMDNNSDSSDDKVRTRRIVRQTQNDLTPSIPATPKRKKVTSNSPSPQQTHHYQSQQLLIDENIPDYSPDVSTLPNNSKCLKIDWKGQPMSLANDPNVSSLHPAEVTLASVLRLPANVYLDSKRRFFYEKVNRVKSGMQFRRTDAQKACRIDVNKASRLFAAFEKVGWLNDELFEKYL